jgi:DNA-binding SARP family transcriptional activator
VWRLRKLLEPQRSARQSPSVLRTEEPGYRLAVPPDTLESHIFIAAVERLPVLLAERDFGQALDLTSSALELWRGEPYEGVPEADWIGPVRERLVALHVDLNEYRVQALLDTGQPERAVSELVPLLAAHPFRERLWAQRMLGLYRSGRQAAALGAFTQVRRLLADELGGEPGPELRALQQELLDQAAGLDPVRPNPAASPGRVQLPSRRSTIIGREDDLAAIVGALGGAGLVTLTGPGGTGKTRLAVEAAFAARGGFPDGVRFIDLTQTDDPCEVVTLTANTLGLGPQPSTTTDQLVLTFLAERQTLLVLDNCEHVLSGARGLADRILDHCPEVTVLATSREPLDLAGETRWPVAPLPVADPDSPTASARTMDGPADAAVALFVERLSNLRPDLDLEGPDGVHIRQICAAVGGLPLGIELAAARARVSGWTRSRPPWQSRRGS